MADDAPILRVLHVGFTGSRMGMTPEQKLALAEMLRMHRERGAIFFHHGDCKGADDQAARIAYELGYTVHVHPGPDGREAGPWRRLSGLKRICVYDVLSMRERNREIVEHADTLIACPSGPEDEQRRSGTWMTVRMARERDMHWNVIPPDVHVEWDDTNDPTGAHRYPEMRGPC